MEPKLILIDLAKVFIATRKKNVRLDSPMIMMIE